MTGMLTNICYLVMYNTFRISIVDDIIFSRRLISTSAIQFGTFAQCEQLSKIELKIKNATEKYLGGHRKNISHAATSLGDVLCAISEEGEKSAWKP